MQTIHYYILGILTVVVILAIFALSSAIKSLVSSKRKEENN